MGLIRIESGCPVINNDAVAKLMKLEKAAKAIKAEQDKLKKELKEEMEAKNVIDIDYPLLKVTYVPEYDRETFDGKKFKADNPKLYDEYVSMTTVKSSIRVKIKEEKK